MANLRSTAAADLRAILNDSSGGAGWGITVTDPDNRTGNLTGFSNDIALVIDPDTGTPVSGRTVTVSLMLEDLAAAGFGVPRGVADTGVKPWRMSFADAAGTVGNFKISATDPDFTLGIITCHLEAYCT